MLFQTVKLPRSGRHGGGGRWVDQALPCPLATPTSTAVLDLLADDGHDRWRAIPSLWQRGQDLKLHEAATVAGGTLVVFDDTARGGAGEVRATNTRPSASIAAMAATTRQHACQEAAFPRRRRA